MLYGLPQITFILAAKRHHIRFKPDYEAGERGDAQGNIPAGTVVDTGVIHPTGE